jgi:hypothetical protein
VTVKGWARAPISSCLTGTFRLLPPRHRHSLSFSFAAYYSARRFTAVPEYVYDRISRDRDTFAGDAAPLLNVGRRYCRIATSPLTHRYRGWKPGPDM